jgi:hypothetical protein
MLVAKQADESKLRAWRLRALITIKRARICRACLHGSRLAPLRLRDSKIEWATSQAGMTITASADAGA